MPRPRAPVGARLFEDRDGRFAIFVRATDGARESKTTLPKGIGRRQAEGILKEAQTAIESGAWHAPQDWSEAIEAFLANRVERGCRKATLDAYRCSLLSVKRTLPGVEPFALTSDHARKFIALRSNCSAATVRGEVAQVVIFQRWAVAQGWQKAVTWQGVRRPAALRPEEGHKRVLSAEEVGRLCRAASKLAETPPHGAPASAWEWWPAALGLLLHGLRRGEMLALRARDVRLVSLAGEHGDERIEAQVAIGQSKTRAGRRAVPVVDSWTVEALRRALDGARPDDLLFQSSRGMSGGAFAAPGIVNVKLRRTCEVAEVDPEGVCAHALRHTFATATIGAVDAVAVQRALGHSRIAVTVDTYTHLAASQAMPAARAFGSWMEQGRQGRPVLMAIK